MKKLFLLIFILLNCKIKTAQRTQQRSKSENEVIQIVNRHLHDEELRNNKSLQKIMNDINNLARREFRLNPINHGNVQIICNKIVQNINKKDYPNLPMVLDDPKYFESFVNNLIKRYDPKTVNDLDAKDLSHILTYNIKYEYGYATGVAFSLDWPLLVTTHINDNKTVLNDIQTGRVKKFNIKDVVYNIAISPDEQLLATYSQDKKIRIFCIHNGNLIAKINCKSDVIRISFSPNGQFLTTYSYNGCVEIIDIQMGEVIETIDKCNPRRVSISPNGQLLAICSYDGTVKVTNMQGRIVVIFKYHDAITDVAFSPCGNLLATLFYDGTTKVTDLKSGKVKTTIDKIDYSHYSLIGAVAFSPDGKLFATCHERKAKVINLEDGLVIRTINHVRPVCDIAFSPDSSQLATCSNDGVGLVTDVQSGNIVASAQIEGGYSDDEYHVAFSSNGLFMLIGPKSTRVSVLNNFLEKLSFGELKLLQELAAAKKINKNVKVTLNQEDEEIFNGLPTFIKLALKQNIKIKFASKKSKKCVIS